MAFLLPLTNDFLKQEAQRYHARARKGREPIRKPRKPEPVRTFERSFSIGGEEFDRMDQSEFIEKYVGHVAKIFPLWIQKELGGRTFRYFKFDLDEDTSTRRTLVLDERDVFVAVKIQRMQVLTHPAAGKYQDEVCVCLRADIMPEEGDP